MCTASWVVVDRATGRAVLETFNRRVVAKINTARYDVLPILDYLVGLNHRVPTTSGRE